MQTDKSVLPMIAVLLLYFAVCSCSPIGPAPLDSPPLPAAVESPGIPASQSPIDEAAPPASAVPEENLPYRGAPLTIPTDQYAGEDEPFLSAFEYASSELYIFQASALEPSTFPIPSPYENFLHPSPNFERVAYISSSPMPETGLDLIVVRTQTGEVESRIPITNPGWERSVEAGETPVDDPIPAIVESTAISWSSDSRYLAFAAAIDRFSADLYVLDTQTQTVSRLTAAESAPNGPTWSPDGGRIAYTQVISFGTGAGWSVQGVWLVDPSEDKDELILEAQGTAYFPLEWLGEDALIVTGGGWVRGDQHLGIIDLESGMFELFFEGPLYLYAAHPGDATYFILSAPSDEDTAVNTYSLYLASPGQNPRRCMALDDEQVFSVGWSPALGVMYAGLAEETVLFSLDCEWIGSVHQGGKASISPDGAWLTSFTPGSEGLTVFSFRTLEQQFLPDLAIDALIWSPQSTGFILVTPDREYYALRLIGEDGANEFSAPQIQCVGPYLSNSLQ
ncbi:MAG: PD40 domain-containing protein [Anaerolineales bacterium]|nr:PD40 domain-containing protein [Anaerolineales bacterium]